MAQAPVSLLLDPALPAAARLLWLAVHALGGPGSVTELAAGTGMTRGTVRKQLAQLQAHGWYSPLTGAAEPSPGAPHITIPAELLPAPGLRPQAKLLYGLLQTLSTYMKGSGQFTVESLCLSAQISAVTARESLRELAETGWIHTTQANRRAPIRFTLRNPVQERSKGEVLRVMERLQEREYRGEAIMQEFLSLLIDSDEFEENARPGFLMNPLTDERMELDRYYYSLALAFEIQGAQHFRTTKRFPNEGTLAMQQARDLMKESLCYRRGIRLIVLTQEDLTLRTIQERVGRLAPLRDLTRHGQLSAALEKVSKAYRR